MKTLNQRVARPVCFDRERVLARLRKTLGDASDPLQRVRRCLEGMARFLMTTVWGVRVPGGAGARTDDARTVPGTALSVPDA